MKLNYKKDLSSKWLWWVLIILAICCFKGCASASSLNISDFDTETFTSPLNYNGRNCEQSYVTNPQTNNITTISNECRVNISNDEWNNNFLKNNYNFLIYPINHSATISNLNYNNTSGGTETLTYLVDYTMKFYLRDINNTIYNCDIVNNSVAMCRYNRNIKIAHVGAELIFLGTNATNSTKLISRIYFQSQYYLTSYSSMNKAITEVNNNISNYTINFDDDNNGVANKVDAFNSYIPTNGSVSQLLTLPITLASAFSSGISGTCSQFNLGELFGTQLILPCINLSSFFGSTLWVVIDIIVGGFMVYAMGKKIIRVFNDMTSLKDNQIDDLYGGGA